MSPAESRENPQMKTGNLDAFFREKCLTKNMQNQGMKLVGALLAGMGTVNVTAAQPEAIMEEAKLPEACGELPGELQSILEFIG